MKSSRHSSPSLLPLLLLLAAFASAACGEPQRGGEPDGPRAILLSVDALNEAIFRETLDPQRAPALHRIFTEGMCADHAVSAFPSVTAASHAVLWTGAYGNVNGVAANLQPRLPRDRHSLLDLLRGFSYEALSAEPLWITGGKAGIPVTGQHVTQAPAPPGYLPTQGEHTPWQRARLEESRQALDRPEIRVVNGYNVPIDPHRLLSTSNTTPGELGEWQGLPEPLRLPPRAFRWESAGRTVHGLLHGEERYDRFTLALEPHAGRGVTARLAPEERAPPRGRELARHFSQPLEIPVEGGRVHLRARLFQVAEDGSDFLLHLPALDLVEGNRPEVTEGYADAVEGWVGGVALNLYRSGELGPTLALGGDGTAEARYLESAELLVRQYIRGTRWMWEEGNPRLHMDYTPLSDAVDHEVLFLLSPEWPGYREDRAELYREFRSRAWELVDLQVAAILELAEAAGAALFVSGDHGMRPSWKGFHPNQALLNAGLLALKEDGSIDLVRSRAVSPNGYWISVNREAWVDGIVPPEEEEEVVGLARAAIEGVRGPSGERVVTRTFTPEEHPEMGLGGPAAGDLYWGTAPGFASSWTVRAGAPAAVTGRVTAGHGFPPDEPDMYTVFCALGGGFQAGRIPAVRTTVVAPTVAEYVGLPRPADATGPSVLAAMRNGDPLVARLQERIWAEGDTITIGLALYDMESEARIRLGAHRPFHAASTMKVPVLLELLRQVEEGRISLDDPLPIRDTFRSIVDGSPFTLDQDVDEGLLEALGGTLPVRRVAHGMITVSSNLGTNLLLETLTPDSVQALMDRMGAGGMQVLRGVSDIPAFEAGLSNRTTADGYLRTLEVLARCEGFRRGSCREMEAILEDQTFRGEIPAGLPSGTRVGNKTGSITGILHDGAVVWPEGRAPYILVLLTEGYTDKEEGSRVMAELSRIVWEGIVEGRGAGRDR